MHYDRGFLQAISFPAIDFGNGTSTKVIAPPRFKRSDSSTRRGRVVGALVYDVTEDFTSVTTAAGVRVGDGADDDLYFDSGLVLDASVDIGESVWLNDDGAQADIPAGESAVTVTFVAPTGGTPAGIASVMLYVNWW